MHRLLVLIPLLALLFAIPAVAQSETRSVDYVLGMLEAGMDNEAIIAHILAEDIRFRVQSGDMSLLRAAGGSDALIEVVVREGVILTGVGEPPDDAVLTGEEVDGNYVVEEAEPIEDCYYVETDCYSDSGWSGSFYVGFGVGWGWWNPWPVYYGPYWVGYWGYPYYPAWGYPTYAYPYYYGGRGGYHNYYYARTEPRGTPRGSTSVGVPIDGGSGGRGGPRGATTVAGGNDPRGGRGGNDQLSSAARSSNLRNQALRDDPVSGSRTSGRVSGSDIQSRPRRSATAGGTQFRGQGRSSASADTRSRGRSRSSVSGDTRSRDRSRSSVSGDTRSRDRSRSSVSGRSGRRSSGSVSGGSRSSGRSRSSMSSRSGRSSGGRPSMGSSRSGSSNRGASGRGGGRSGGGSRSGGSRGGNGRR